MAIYPRLVICAIGQRYLSQFIIIRQGYLSQFNIFGQGYLFQLINIGQRYSSQFVIIGQGYLPQFIIFGQRYFSQFIIIAAAIADACSYWASFSAQRPHLQPLLRHYAARESDAFLAFLLDPASQPPVIALIHEQGKDILNEVCHLTRTWLYQLHRARFRALGLWEYLL